MTTKTIKDDWLPGSDAGAHAENEATPRALLGFRIDLPLLVVLVLSYASSRFLLDKYTGGDLYWYRLFYESVAGVGINDVPYFQYTRTGSSEKVYGILIWLASSLVDRQVFISVANSIFCGLLYLYMRSHRVPFWVMPVLFTNYYLLVCLTSAERLKFSLIMLLLFLLVRSRARYLFAALAPLTHLQTFILYFALAVSHASAELGKVLTSGGASIKKVAAIGVLAAFALLIMFLRMEYIIWKLKIYTYNAENDFLSLAVLAFASLISFRDRLAKTLPMISLMMVAALIGDSRVNMVGYLVYFYFSVQSQQTRHPAFLLISLYLSYKSISFVDNIIHFGTGYVAF